MLYLILLQLFFAGHLYSWTPQMHTDVFGDTKPHWFVVQSYKDWTVHYWICKP